MGKKNRQKRPMLKLRDFDQMNADELETEICPQDIKEKKAEEVKSKLSEYHVENYREIKKLFIILDLWVKHNREHQELMDLPFANNRKLEIRLFNHINRESKVVIHQ